VKNITKMNEWEKEKPTPSLLRLRLLLLGLAK
jgi:hypothetical protein